MRTRVSRVPLPRPGSRYDVFGGRDWLIDLSVGFDEEILAGLARNRDRHHITVGYQILAALRMWLRRCDIPWGLIARNQQREGAARWELGAWRLRLERRRERAQTLRRLRALTAEVR